MVGGLHPDSAVYDALYVSLTLRNVGATFLQELSSRLCAISGVYSTATGRKKEGHKHAEDNKTRAHN